jgi:hypothetical protein
VIKNRDAIVETQVSDFLISHFLKQTLINHLEDMYEPPGKKSVVGKGREPELSGNRISQPHRGVQNGYPTISLQANIHSVARDDRYGTEHDIGASNIGMKI